MKIQLLDLIRVGKAKPRRLERSKLVKGANDRKGRQIKQGQGGNLETKDIFSLGSFSEKKYGIFWEFFPTGGGGGSPQSQNFCDLTK